MEELRKRLDALTKSYRALSLGVRVGLLTGVGMAIALGLWAYFAGSRVEQSVLLANLSDEDAAQVIEALNERHLPFTLGEGGHTVLVPADSVLDTRNVLASSGVLGRVQGFELYDEDHFGRSDFETQVQYQRALTGELTRTIKAIRGVRDANVHLVLPARSLFINDEQTASASVQVQLRPGVELSRAQVRGIIHMVSHAVRNLHPENVAVTDGEGVPLIADGEGNESNEQAMRSLRFRKEVEGSKERAIQQMLDATLGPGAAVVRVSVDVTFAQEELTEERFDPNATAERSHQITEERDSNSDEELTAEGVPGAAANLPGSAAPGGGLQDENARNLVRRSETRNFEVSHTKRHTTEPIGRVERVNAAVLVDYVNRGTAARPNLQPRTEQEIREIQEVVSSAVGAQTDRGDQVTVRQVKFNRAPEPEQPKDVLKNVRPFFPLVVPTIALVALVAGSIFGFAAFRRKAKAETEERERLLTLERENGGVLPGSNNDSALAAALGASHMRAPRVDDSIELGPAPDERVLLASQIATEDPQTAAKVLRQWLSEGGE